eukprot:11087350-Alexandrium_andersonii.AAC.1
MLAGSIAGRAGTVPNTSTRQQLCFTRRDLNANIEEGRWAKRLMEHLRAGCRPLAPPVRAASPGSYRPPGPPIKRLRRQRLFLGGQRAMAPSVKPLALEAPVGRGPGC